MKYYIYISDAKVDMLFPQVPHDIKRKVSTKFGFDFKVVSASRQTEAETDESRISRLETVVEFIREFGNLGTVEQPDEYVEGDLVLHTAVFPDRNPKYVYFGGSRAKFATPAQRMEFLAKRLLHEDRMALLATPLYVALTG
jgi:hypothetical protein